jgi:hypothetical protein
MSLEGGILNSWCTSGVVREFHLRQHISLVRAIVAVETAQKLILERAIDERHLSIHL